MAFSQSILVNNQSVNVSSDISFPYWLDSTSTLAIDSYVVSISVLEFNITPTTNGNSLVFNQAKTVTSQENVPSGKTWKVESVLLDPSFVSTSNNSNGTTVVSGGGGTLRPVALSTESSSTMNVPSASLYCDSLVEDGYDNWVLPTLEEILFVAGGGGLVPGNRSSNYLWTNSRDLPNHYSYFFTIDLSTFNINNEYPGNFYLIRCVRHAAVTVSSGGGSSSSGGSGNVVSSGLTPIAISAESPNTMSFNNAMLYCDTLDENNFQDWILPTIDDMTFVNSGGIDFTDIKTEEYLWTRSLIQAGTYPNYNYLIKLNNELTQNANITYAYLGSSNIYKTRCIRRGAVTVSSSGGGSSSGGSTPATLGAGMPTMISNESSSVMLYGNCVLYCDSLSENGHSDWIMPTIDQLTYASSGGCIIPDTRSSDYIWSRSFQTNENAIIYMLIPPALDNGYDQVANKRTDNPSNFGSTSYQPKCRCVR